MTSNILGNEWNGICACGKVAMDGVRCYLGATHQPLKVKYPWEVEPELVKKFRYPWENEK